MRVLVSGTSGFIESALASALTDRGYRFNHAEVHEALRSLLAG
jgi:nucleoside-diphosphate-sugar epimerase